MSGRSTTSASTWRRGRRWAWWGERLRKTTTGRAILRAVEPIDGKVMFKRRDGSRVDVTQADDQTIKLLRQEMQLVFQDPFASLNPRMTLFDIVADPLKVNRLAKGQELEDRVIEMFRRVGLSTEYVRRYPHAFSGGQRQRVGIARALVMNPRLVIADEPVSALDVSVQAQILNLMQDLQAELGLTYVFISHDLSVVQYISHRVVVMYVGKIVESASTGDLFTAPKHPYTQALLSSVPVPGSDVRAVSEAVVGEVADPANPPGGCSFNPRCPFAQDICRTTTPPLVEVAPGHQSRCHFAHELDLPGVTA